MRPLVIITGVGPGTGSAMARRFHDGGYQVAMLARTAERLTDLERELPNAFAVPCDVADPAALTAALDAIEQRAGVPKVVIHNAVGGAFGNFLDIDPQVLQQNFQINVMALLHLARWAAPRLEVAGAAPCWSQATPRPFVARLLLPALHQARRRSASWPSPSLAKWGPGACTCPS